ncbi:MAG: FAD-binding oxidoreductase [Gammaproteobacteria bacterium]
MTAQPRTDPRADDLRRALTGLLGAEAVLIDESLRRFNSADIYAEGPTAALVIRPADAEGLAAAVATVTDAGYGVIGRGGGTSYTGGLLPDREATVVIDTGALDRIVEIDQEDMVVSVDAGVTWEALHVALKDTAVQVPFRGPLSGARATIGGSLSQNAILWGSGVHGVSAESVLSLQVALADGTLLETGSASVGAKPFFRQYGPDLTGLFLGDSGALGIKTRAVLRLMRRPGALRFASFNFDGRRKLCRAMTSLAREGVAATCFGMDPMLQYQRIRRASVSQGVSALKGVIGAADDTFSGIRRAMRIAVGGRRFIDENGYSLHLVIEAEDQGSADAKLESARRICLAEGTDIGSAVPTMLHGAPFVPMTSAIGPEGERWAPMHGLFALSDADEAWERIEALIDDHAARFDRLGIVAGVLLATVSTTTFVIEPVFYWPGPRTVWYEHVLSSAERAKFRDFPADPEVDAAVEEMRERLNRLFDDLGAAHLQIGKEYHYRERLGKVPAALLTAIKQAVDPKGLMNPGALGFPRHAPEDIL